MRTDAILTLTQKAIRYAEKVNETALYKRHLSDAFNAWHHENARGEHITRGDPVWTEMMIATTEEQRQLRNAKSRERKAQKALLRAVQEVQL